ncbi:ABC transporter ATP-binding protein [Thermosulfuriphilus sp.]
MLLEIRNLNLILEPGGISLVEDLNLYLNFGEILCLVGESGCGKSLTALAIMGLLPPGIKRQGGQIFFGGRDLCLLSSEELRRLRGATIAMIFQEPMTALNPVFTIGEQIAEVIETHEGLSRQASLAKASELLKAVGVPAAEERLHAYPHELSGGLRQRAMIAMALACSPKLIIADEPTTALDVTIQAQIIELLQELKRKRNLALLLITHNLGVVAEMADRVAVMYAGQLVEVAETKELFARPLHPYTKGLMDSLPGPQERLSPIGGQVPPPGSWPKGCRFRGRCPYEDKVCHNPPKLVEVYHGHLSRCHLARDFLSTKRTLIKERNHG